MKYYKYINSVGYAGMVLEVNETDKAFRLYAPCTAPLNAEKEAKKTTRKNILALCEDMKKNGYKYWTNTAHAEYCMPTWW